MVTRRERERENARFVNNISVPRLREKLWKLHRASGTPARLCLSLSFSLPSSVYFSSAASEAGIIKLVSRGRARVLFPLCQKERKSKLQRVKRARARMSGTTMMNETSLLLILAVIVFLFLFLEWLKKERTNRLIKSNKYHIVTHIMTPRILKCERYYQR